MSPQQDKAVSLERYLDFKVSALKELIEVRLVEFQRAVSVANLALEKRLESQNQWREQSKDQGLTLLPRNEWMTDKTSVENDIRKIYETLKGMVSKSEYDPQHEALRKAVESLATYRAVAESKASQAQVMVANMLAVLGVVLGIVSMLWKH